MKSLKEYTSLLQERSGFIKDKFGVTSLRIFGSVAREQHTEGSDIDIFVEMPPKMLLLSELRMFLEDTLMVPVDLVRQHKNMNPLLRQEISNDSIYVF